MSARAFPSRDPAAAVKLALIETEDGPISPSRLGEAAEPAEVAILISRVILHPISGALTFSGAAKRWLLREDVNIDEAIVCIDGIVAELKRANDLVGTMRKLLEKEHPPAERLDMRQVLAGAAAVLDPTNNFGLYPARHPTPLPFRGNREQVSKVLRSLMSYALRGMRQIGLHEGLTLETTTEGAFISIRLWVDGDVQTRAKTNAYLLSIPSLEPDAGSIGFDLCRSVMATHSGAVSVGFEKTDGVVIRICLPIDGAASRCAVSFAD